MDQRTNNTLHIIKETDGEILLNIKVQARASKTEIASIQDQELKIRVTEAPVDNAANIAVIKLLADTFDCPKSNIRIVKGTASNHKIIAIRGLTKQNVIDKLGSIKTK